MPLVFDMPKYVALITKEDKVILVNKLMKEKKQIEMIKTLLEIAECNTNILMEEFLARGAWNNNGANDWMGLDHIKMRTSEQRRGDSRIAILIFDFLFFSFSFSCL
jgi:hypothetical protein